MMLLVLMTGQRMEIDPSIVDTIIEMKTDAKRGMPEHCHLIVGNFLYPITLTFDQYKDAVVEYYEEIGLLSQQNSKMN